MRSATMPGVRTSSRPGTAAAIASCCRRPRSERASVGAPLAAAPEPSRLVGREAELAGLANGFEQARAGRRQLVLRHGRAWYRQERAGQLLSGAVASRAVLSIAYGQCLDQHGAGEPYLPLIEAVTRLAGQQDGPEVKRNLFRSGPSWLAQMPSLWSGMSAKTLEARGHATRERMMRELTLALEAVASETPLILKLEDIHWSDASTIDWLGHRRRAARIRLAS